MSRVSRLLVVSASALVFAAGCANQPVADSNGALGEPARRYEGYGRYSRKITTSSAEAQEWFNQGMQLLYGFNHDEAIRSFNEAARLDPQCAMAHWGIAYASGLHINNMMMTPEQSKRAWDSSRRALELIDGASPAEQALVRAVAQRYSWPATADRRALDESYAAGMREARGAFPSDPDIGALYAESLMDLQPWDYWTSDGRPKGNAAEIVRTLESVLALHPNHPGANHFYIHAVEASSDPDRAIAAAERLSGLVPGSGHLVHMPSHIFARVGRYTDASESNVRAVEVDAAYFAKAPAPGFYRIYYIHNLHFLTFASMMEGRYDAAITAARRVEKEIPEEFLRENAFIADAFMPTAMEVLVRFGRWEEVLKEPKPPSYRKFSIAMWRYCRGVSLAALDRKSEAREELEAFRRAVKDVPDAWMIGNNTCLSVLEIASRMLEGELAFREGERERCFTLLREAIVLEDKLRYDEPPGWMHPVRHALGALLIADGRAAEAEAVYRDDLKRNRENGWALTGMEQALRAQSRSDEAAKYRARRDLAWSRADVAAAASCYCQPATE